MPTDYPPDSLAAALTDVHTALLLSTAGSRVETTTCLNLCFRDDHHDHVVGVRFPGTPGLQTRLTRATTAAAPDTVSLVNVGVTPGDADVDATVNRRTVDADDPTAVTANVLDAVAAVTGNDGVRTALCFDSVTKLLDRVGIERAFPFLDELTARLADLDVDAHFHLDPAHAAGKDVVALTTLFDAVAESTDGESWRLLQKTARSDDEPNR